MRVFVVFLIIALVSVNSAPSENRLKRHLPGLGSIGELGGKVTDSVKGGVGKGLDMIGDQVQSGGQMISDIGSKIGGNGKNSEQDQNEAIKKALDQIHSSINDVVDDVKKGPTDQIESKLDKFNSDMANGKKVGDNALVGIYAQMDKAYQKDVQDDKSKQELRQGVEGAKKNWNSLIHEMDEGEKVVQDKIKSASGSDRDRLQKVIQQFESGKSVLEQELINSDTCFLGVL